MDWMEAVSNRWADKWMAGTDKNVFFRRFFVRPDEFMDKPYLLRWAVWIFALLAATPFFAGISGFITDALTTPSLNRRFHIPVPSLKALFFDEAHTLSRLLGSMSLILLLTALLMLCRLGIRAYFWNRRAQRLQAYPPMPPNQVPGVWPPPPRIAD